MHAPVDNAGSVGVDVPKLGASEAEVGDESFFFFQAEDGIRDHCVTGVQTCALPISEVLLQRGNFGCLAVGGGLVLQQVVQNALAQRALGDFQFIDAQQAQGRNQDAQASGDDGADRKSVVEGKSGDLGGRRIIKKKKK